CSLSGTCSPRFPALHVRLARPGPIEPIAVLQGSCIDGFWFSRINLFVCPLSDPTLALPAGAAGLLRVRRWNDPPAGPGCQLLPQANRTTCRLPGGALLGRDRQPVGSRATDFGAVLPVSGPSPHEESPGRLFRRTKNKQIPKRQPFGCRSQ